MEKSLNNSHDETVGVSQNTPSETIPVENNETEVGDVNPNTVDPLVTDGTNNQDPTSPPDSNPAPDNTTDIPPADSTLPASEDATNEATPPAVTTLTFDFADGIPSTATSSNLTVSKSALTLTQDSSGAYSTSGSVELSLAGFSAAGKLIKLVDTRISSLDNGDFETSQTINDHTVTKSTGAWFAPLNVPTVASDTSGDHYVSLNRNGASPILQYFKMAPGTGYQIKFVWDSSNMLSTDSSVQEFSVVLQYFDADFNKLQVNVPFDNKIAKGIDEGLFTKHHAGDEINLRAYNIDCDHHRKYTANDGYYTSSIDFNFCLDASGNPLKKLDSTDTEIGTYSASDLQYAALYFKSLIDGPESTDKTHDIKIKSVFVDREDQIEIELLDDAGTILQSSTLDNGFYVNPNIAPTKIRVWLRSDKTTDSPKINSLTITSTGIATKVAIGAALATYSEPRIAGNASVTPRSEFNDESMTDVRTLCKDTLNADEQKSCYKIFSDREMKVFRGGISTSYLEASYNSTNTDYEFRLTDTAEFMYGTRYQQAFDQGALLGALIVFPDGPDSKITMSSSLHRDYCATITDTTNSCCYSGGKRRSGDTGWSCYLSDFPDPTKKRTDTKEQALYMTKKYAEYATTLFNGTTVYTKDDGTTMTMPKPKFFEVFNEINGGSYRDGDVTVSWLSTPLTQTEFLSMINSVADGIHETDPNARISTPSILGHTHLKYNYDIIDTDYLKNTIGSFSSSFTDVSLHPYVTYPSTPEDILSEWETTKTILQDAGWGDRTVHTTEWGYTQNIYDPYCNSTSGTYSIHDDAVTTQPNWTRSWGENEHAKLVARQTLVHASLPFQYNFHYGIFSSEAEYGGYDIRTSSGYVCWKMGGTANFYLMDRIDGYGIFSGKDEPTIYQPSTSGVAYLTLGNLKIEDPYTSSISAETPRSDDSTEHYYSSAFKTKDGGLAVGVWFYKNYLYTDGSSDYINFYTGTKDDGFTETRLHDVTLTGLPIAPQTVIIQYLDGTSETANTEKAADGSLVVKGVVFGEMPVIIKMMP